MKQQLKNIFEKEEDFAKPEMPESEPSEPAS
jgi:hypothetical protein